MLDMKYINVAISEISRRKQGNHSQMIRRCTNSILLSITVVILLLIYVAYNSFTRLWRRCSPGWRNGEYSENFVPILLNANKD